MRKGLSNLIFLAVTLGLIAYAGSYLVPPSMIASIVADVTGTCQTISKPFYGTLTCSPVTGGTVTKVEEHTINKGGTTILGNGQGWYNCKEFGDTNQCTIYVKAPTFGLLDAGRNVKYYICDGGTGSAGSGSCSNWYNVDLKTFLPKAGNLYTIKVNLGSTQNIYMQYIKGCCSVTGNEGEVVAEFVPFVLWRQDATNGGNVQVPNAKDCTAPTETYDNGLSTAALVKNAEYYKVLNANRLVPYETFNYISNWYDDSRPLETYNNALAVCVNRVMYGLNQHVTDEGCYQYVDLSKVLGSVACCNNEVMPTSICKNHQWTTSAQCATDNDCPMAGSWNRDTTDSTGHTIFTQECLNSVCTKVKKVVACVTSDTCPNGQVCVAGTYVCKAQEGGGGGNIVCGNGYCERGEDKITCPADCDKTSNALVYWIKQLLLGLLLSVLIVVIVTLIAWLSPIPLLRPLATLLINPRNFLIAVLVLTILMVFVLQLAVGSIVASIFG